MSQDAQQVPDGTKPPFLQAQITKPANRKTINFYAGQAHDGLPIQSLQIESVKAESLKQQKMCASDSSFLGGLPSDIQKWILVYVFHKSSPSIVTEVSRGEFGQHHDLW
jgi:hypothetical protein